MRVLRTTLVHYDLDIFRNNCRNLHRVVFIKIFTLSIANAVECTHFNPSFNSGYWAVVAVYYLVICKSHY